MTGATNMNVTGNGRNSNEHSFPPHQIRRSRRRHDRLLHVFRLRAEREGGARPPLGFPEVEARQEGHPRRLGLPWQARHPGCEVRDRRGQGSETQGSAHQIRQGVRGHHGRRLRHRPEKIPGHALALESRHAPDRRRRRGQGQGRPGHRRLRGLRQTLAGKHLLHLADRDEEGKDRTLHLQLGRGRGLVHTARQERQNGHLVRRGSQRLRRHDEILQEDPARLGAEHFLEQPVHQFGG